MILTRNAYSTLQQGIKDAKARKTPMPVVSTFKESGDTLFFAAVDLLEAINTTVVAVNNVYQYSATLYYKQFSPHSDPNEFVKDVDLTQYKAGESVILLSAWDLKLIVDTTAVTQIAVVPCVQRNNYFENLALAPGSVPDTSLTNDNFGQSLNLRIHTEDGIITAAWEILGFYEGIPESKVLEDILSVDETGNITGSGASNYKLLVRVDDSDGRPRIGYMRFHPSDDPEYPDDSTVDCGVGDFPGTLPGDDDSGGFPGEDEPTEDEEQFPGEPPPGQAPGDDDFPGKVDDCW